MNSYFRDHQIAASLKLMKGSYHPAQSAHFRDHQIAASLKPLDESPFCFRLGPFPRSPDRGLIEA